MSNPRTNIDDLKLQGSGNLKRALAREPQKQLAKRAELEQLFADVTERRREAMADVKKNGQIINQEKSNSRGMLYIQRIVNPSLHIVRQCELQLASLARLLTQFGEPAPREKTTEEMADSFKDLMAN